MKLLPRILESFEGLGFRESFFRILVAAALIGAAGSAVWKWVSKL